MKKRIYFDYAAATPLDKGVKKAMDEYNKNHYANPSALYTSGQDAKTALEYARKNVAKVLQCKAEEIIFTSSGTESINLALLGLAKTKNNRGHIITTLIEHKSVLESLKALEEYGFENTYLPVNEEGIINISELENAITNKTFLVSIGYANNEIGVIQSISEIAMIIKKINPEIIFHTDACQAAGALPLTVERLGVDMLSLNGGKFYGPKGTGILFKKKNIELEPIIYGGGQEKGMRAGTENISGAIGFAKALELTEKLRKGEVKRLTNLRDYTIEKILKISGSNLNGDVKNRLPNNINVSFKGVDGEKLVIYMDDAGVEIATGSACTAKSVEPSHVITALGNSREKALEAIRITIGKQTTKSEVDKMLKTLEQSVHKIRSL